MVYEKREYYLNRRRCNCETTCIFWKMKQKLCSLS